MQTYRGSCLNVYLDMVTMFAHGSEWEAWISDLHIAELNQSLEMTAAQHKRLPLLSPPLLDCNVLCAECSVPPPSPPSCFLSVILLHQWGNVWPCRTKQQLRSQSVRGSVRHSHPPRWFLRWIQHPKETLEAPARSRASSLFSIVALSPANIEGNKSLFTPKCLRGKESCLVNSHSDRHRRGVFQPSIGRVSLAHCYFLFINKHHNRYGAWIS